MNFWKNLSPIARFLIAFCVLLGAFYAFYYSGFYTTYIMPRILNVQAMLANNLLKLMGHQTFFANDSIASDKFRVSIKSGCDGIEATAVFVTAVLAMPLVSWREKWPGLLTGVLVLSILNILRIAGLYLAGLYWPSLFEILHLHGGVVIFLMFSIVLWLIWVNRILKRRQTSQK